jgi:uncharacterized LabA/DUF88 family protein
VNQNAKNNYAFIDSQNVNLSIRRLGWKLDFARLRVYLQEKLDVSRAYIFIGYLPGNERLYTALQSMGYICIFKPTLIHDGNVIKGNCDAELVLQAMIDYAEYNKAIIATGDGDFHCLIKYWIENAKLEAIIIPDKHRFSALLNFKLCRPYHHFLNDLQQKLALNKERPHKDDTL